MKKDSQETEALIKKLTGDSKQLLPKGKEERAKKLSEVDVVIAEKSKETEAISRRVTALKSLQKEVAHIRKVVEPRRLEQMRRDFEDAKVKPDEWDNFSLSFKVEVDSFLATKLTEAEKEFDAAVKGAAVQDEPPSTAWSVQKLTDRRTQLAKEIGADKESQNKYDKAQRAINEATNKQNKLKEAIKKAEGADVRRAALIKSRREVYQQVFDTFVEEEGILQGLYAPIEANFADATGSLGKLKFSVRRKVELSAWAERGEELFDLRSAGIFKGKGAVRKAAEKTLAAVWRNGKSNEVADAMEKFKEEAQDGIKEAMPGNLTLTEKSMWFNDVASWLYDSSQITIEYGITFDGVPIEQLSPGTRGIVLLLLYLVIDQNDQRPLLIDQPEENLDPNSVYDELVPHFRAARKRRQIIIVTHNANLVVNTDADEVIVASAERAVANSLPLISYKTGSLENPDIRRLVCQILEGGERAFIDRERRYRLREIQTSEQLGKES